MMKIRTLQLSAFGALLHRDLESRLIRQIAQCFPTQYRYLGEPLVRSMVSASVERAISRLQTTEMAIRVFVALAFALGIGFDHDPQLAWAADALSNNFTDENGRARLLYVRGMEYCRDVVGHGSQYYVKALSQIMKRDLRNIWSDAVPWTYSDEFACELRDIYPEKIAAIGLEGARRLCELGRVHGARNDMFSELDVGRYILLMLILGSEFERDPRFPWIAPLLMLNARRSPGSRCDALYEAAQRHAEKWISHVLT